MNTERPFPVSSSTQLPVWRQLRWNLVIYFVLLAVLPVVAAVIVTLSQTRSQARDQVISQLESVSELKLAEINSWLSGNQEVLRATGLGSTSFARFVSQAGVESTTYELDQQAVSRLLAQVDTAHQGFNELFLYDLQGKVLASSDTAQIGKIVTRQPYFAPSLVSGDYIQPPYYDATTGELTMVLTHLLFDTASRPVKVLAGRLDTNTLAQIMTERTGLGESGETYLVSIQNNYLLTPSRYEGYELTRAYHSEGIDRALAGQSGSGTYPDYRDPPQNVIGVYRWVPVLQAGLMSELDEAEALAAFEDVQNFSAVLAVVAAVLAALIGLGAAWTISRPITRLTAVAADVAAGDLSRRAVVRQRNEIGVLAGAFNAMTDRLQDLIGSLEQRVSARTRDLFLTLEVGQLATRSYQEPDLLSRLTEYIRQQFGLYYTQIYLLDQAQRYAVLEAGTGEVGQQLLARKHRLDLSETSIVARTVQGRAPILVSDTQTSAIHRPNPLLPDTRSEVAVPLIVGDEILGVLDMQATQPGTFNQDNLAVFQAMAAQIAAALRSAQSFQETQAAVRRADQINARLTHEQWLSYLGRVGEGQRLGYAYDLRAVAEVVPETVPTVHSDGGNGHGLNRLIQLRGEPIGQIKVGGDDDRQWSDEELALIEGVAERVALAVEQFRAFDETQKRAAEMQTVSEVSAESSRTLEPEQLLWTVSNLVKERFGLYHAHIYLLDETGEQLELAAGAGEAGRTMVAEGRQIALSNERSLVARAAREREAVVVNDVRQAPDFLPNPLLPDTRSEMAIPMVVGEQLIGVLDVQSDQVNRFTADDAQVQQTLAAQVAVALNNARLFAQSAQRLAIIETADSMVSLADMKGNIIYMNPAGRRMVGWAENEELASKRIADVHPPESIELVTREGIPQALSTGLWRGEHYLKRVDGTLLPIEQTIFVVRDTQGNPLHLATFMTDITERKAAEEALQQQFKFLQDLIDAIPNPIFFKDIQGVYLGCNRAFEAYLGRTRQDIIGLSVFDMAPADLAEQYHAKDLELFHHPDEGQIYESSVVYADGNRHDVIFNKAVYRDVQGNVAGLVGTIVDITERKAAEEQLRQASLIVESSPAMLFRWDVATGWKVQVVSQNVSQLGCTAQELLSGELLYSDLVHPEDLPRVEAEVDAHVAAGAASMVLEYRVITKDGRVRWVEERNTVLRDAQGNALGFQGLVIDTTERREAQLAIQKRAVEMQTVAEVGAESSRTLDPAELLWDVANLTKDRFGLYHAHIYLLDEAGEQLALAAGAGEAGRTMVAEGRRIALSNERSLVARAAREREAVVVNDVQQAPDFLPNPLLPDTRSEMAIPMVVGEQLIGVLDVQSDQVNRFTADDVQVQQTLAAQVAIAVQNARQFEETQRRVRDLQAISRVTEVIRSAENLERMLEEIVDAVVETFGADTGAITRLDLEQQVWLGVVGGTTGLTTDIVKTFREQAEVYPNGLDAVKMRDVVATYDVSNYPNFPAAYVEALGLKSVIVIPIEFTPTYASVLYVNFVSKFHQFTPEEVDLARSLADQISVGIVSKRAEEAVREQQALLRSIIDTSPDWIFAKDKDYRYLLVNRAFARDYGGLTPEQMIGKDDYELGTPVELIEGNPEKGIVGFRVDDRRVVEDERLIHNPYDVANLADGTQHIFDTNKLPLRNAQGEVIGVLGIARDVTERIQAERERLEREQLLRAIIDSTPDWIFVKDQNFRFQLVNKGFADAQNMRPEDFLGKDDYDLGFPPHLIEGDPAQGIVGFRTTDQQALSGEVVTIPYDPVMFADGSVHILDTIKTPLRNAQGDVIAMLGVGHDVTERQQLLEQLQQTGFKLAERLKELAALQDVGAYGEENLALEEYLTRVANRIPASMQYPEETVAAIEFGGEIYGDRRALETHIGVTNALTIADQTVGRLVVGYTSEHDFLPEEIPHLRDIAGRVSTYLENRQLFEQTQQALEQTATLFNSSRTLIMSNEPQALLQAMVGTTLKDGACSAILFYNEGANLSQPDEMVVAAADSSSDQIVPPPVGARFKIDELPFTQEIAQNPLDIVQVPDLEAVEIDETFLAGSREANIRSSVFIPLTTRAGNWVGTVALNWPEPHTLSEKDQQLLAVLAPQMATVIENQRLLEQTIRRAAEMQTVAEVGAEASSSLDPSGLLLNVSNLTKERFGLYHAHIYLVDDTGERLVLAAGAGVAGQRMLEVGHDIPLNHPRSLVARAARSRQVIISNNVVEEEGFLPNPLLPDTKSEMAIPMIASDTVIGVLDVQSDRANRFTDEDVQLKSTLASQVAVAVQNARLYAEQVKVADQLREVDRLKSEFLASMSHELRTPLNSIIGYAEVLLDGIDGDLTEDMNEDISAIHGSGKHLLNLINDILDLAKIEAGQMDLVREEVELQPFVQDVLQTARVLLQSKPVELLVDMPDDLPHVWADSLRLRQVVSNLITNAIKFTEQGSITVRARVYEPDPTKLQISVVDTGIGISAQNLPLVFERFRQVDQSHTRRVGGTGLGLSITRQLVQMHGGDIWVESEVGVGSAFSFTIPTIEAARAEA